MKMLEVRLSNWDHLATADVANKPITWEDKIIGLLTRADYNYLYGRIEPDYLIPLDHIISISVLGVTHE